jgi:hypothetical protein
MPPIVVRGEKSRAISLPVTRRIRVRRLPVAAVVFFLRLLVVRAVFVRTTKNRFRSYACILGWGNAQGQANGVRQLATVAKLRH